jgi:hypothetical protein
VQDHTLAKPTEVEVDVEMVEDQGDAGEVVRKKPAARKRCSKQSSAVKRRPAVADPKASETDPLSEHEDRLPPIPSPYEC